MHPQGSIHFCAVDGGTAHASRAKAMAANAALEKLVKS
jgi:hypothetical protein